MKNTVLSLLLLTLVFISCKEEKTNNTNPEQATEDTQAGQYTVDASASSVGWTAYKTTAKTPVSGKFTQLKIDNPVYSTTPQGALEGLDFEIPVSSFFSDNDERDNKIKSLFWGIMKNTSIISGTFKKVHGDDKKGIVYVTLIMNEVPQDVSFTYIVEGNKINIKGAIMLMNWKIQEAFDSLHKACEALHTGEDGISKTWQEVAINAVAVVNKK